MNTQETDKSVVSTVVCCTVIVVATICIVRAINTALWQ